jgi:hypothetical protein
MSYVKNKIKNMKTNITDLKDFVTHQATEDAALPASERKYQEQLVADVLGQETTSNKMFKELLTLYRTQKKSV